MDSSDSVPEGFTCQRCGNCCRWEGEVRISHDEAERIADYLGLSPDDFINKYTRLNSSRSGLILGERADGACVFFSESPSACSINSVKPRQCCEFPHHWQNAGWEELCAGAAASVNCRESLSGRQK